MDIVLDFIFECILSPNEKIKAGKENLKLAGTAVRTVENVANKKYNNLEDCYYDAEFRTNQDVEKMFEGVKAPW